MIEGLRGYRHSPRMEFRVAQWKRAAEPRPGEVASAQARAATREDSAALDWEAARRAMRRPCSSQVSSGWGSLIVGWAICNLRLAVCNRSTWLGSVAAVVSGVGLCIGCVGACAFHFCRGINHRQHANLRGIRGGIGNICRDWKFVFVAILFEGFVLRHRLGHLHGLGIQPISSRTRGLAIEDQQASARSGHGNQHKADNRLRRLPETVLARRGRACAAGCGASAESPDM